MRGIDACRGEIGLGLFVAEARLIPDLTADLLDDAMAGDGVTTGGAERHDGLPEQFERLLSGDRGQVGRGASAGQRREKLAPVANASSSWVSSFQSSCATASAAT